MRVQSVIRDAYREPDIYLSFRRDWDSGEALDRRHGLKVKRMLFIVYWEIDLEKLPDSMKEVKGMKFGPIEGLKEIAAYVMGSGRAFNVIEAENAEAVFKYIQPVAHLFKRIEASPAMTFKEFLALF